MSIRRRPVPATQIFGVACPICSVEFYLTPSFANVCERTGRTFWCPNGHPVSMPTDPADVVAAAESILKGGL